MTKRLWMAVAAVWILTAGAPEGRPAGAGSRRLDFLAGYLDLTDSQKSQAQSIFDSAAQEGRAARGQLAAAREALHAAAKAGKSEAELDSLAAELGAKHGQLAAVTAKAAARFYALLTPEQKQKYDQLRTRSAGGRRFGRR